MKIDKHIKDPAEPRFLAALTEDRAQVPMYPIHMYLFLYMYIYRGREK